MSNEPMHRLASAAVAIEGRVTQAFDAVERVRDAVLRVLLGAATQSRQPCRDDIGELRPLLTSIVSIPSHSVSGIGVATAAGLLTANTYWLEWWRRESDGQVRFVRHNLNPAKDDYYDYSDRDWFTIPATTGLSSVVGPYVDTGGTNQYTVTVSLPVYADGVLVGVAGADLIAGSFETTLLRVLASRDQEVVLLNSQRRVIASNTSESITGALHYDQEDVSSAEMPLLTDRAAGDLPWRLLYRP